MKYLTRMSPRRARGIWLVAAASAGALLPLENADANVKFEPDKSHVKPKLPKEKTIVSNSAPVLLKSDEMVYDQDTGVVTARGHVEIAQGDTVILCDTLSYDNTENKVRASGNISMLTPSGDVYFADHLEFQEDLKKGVIHQFKARLSDNSVFVASGARKVDENITELFKAAYTPCKCHDEEGRAKTPLWALKSAHATIDHEAQEIRYEDAQMQVKGVPIAYSPYFSHPTPGADNQSGLLMPEFMQSQQLGSVYRQPAYYSIAPDRDLTITPMLTSNAGPVAIGSYRQLFDSGLWTLDGSITNAPNRDAGGNHAPGHEVRGHFDTVGNFKINDHYDWGFSAHRSTDDTYLHVYNFSNETLLTSRVYAEGFNFVGDSSRNYASAEGLSFQGLTGQDISDVIPVVAPLLNFTWQSDPGVYNARYAFDGNAMILQRQTGDNSRRLSGTNRLNLPYITDDGQAIEFNAQLRTDIYDVSNVQLADGRSFSGTTGRVVPEASVLWHYPFINRFDTSSVMVEPVLHFAVSPGGGNPAKIPNEDSLLPEFTDANLFSSNRFAGLDRIENGPRLSYGLRSHAQILEDKYVDILVGQQYRVNNDPTFPISNDLNSQFSDFVGKIDTTYQKFAFDYRFRIDKDEFAPRRSEWSAGYNGDLFTINASYLLLNKDPILDSREVINAGGSVKLTDEWSLTASGSQDLQRDETVGIYSGLVYKNECVTLTTMVGKDYLNLQDIRPSLNFWFRVSLKNLE